MSLENLSTTEETPQGPTHEIELGGQLYVTDLPEDIKVFGPETTDATTNLLNPRDLDKLGVGNWTFKFAGADQEAPHVVARSVITREGPKGLVIDSDSLFPSYEDGIDHWTYEGGGAEILRTLGYELSPDASGKEVVTGVPTPETLRKAAAEQGIDVEFFDEGEQIQGPKYLDAFARGKYPVSYMYYDHDISDDHFTALVLGGDSMKAGLRRVAQEALEQDEDTQHITASGIDAFTSYYKWAFAYGLDNEVKETGLTAKELVIKAGKPYCGLTEAEVEDMFEAGIAKAKELGMIDNEPSEAVKAAA